MFCLRWLLLSVCVTGLTLSGIGWSSQTGSPERDKKLAQWGIADVTLPPYLADPSGKIDSTKAIQGAVDQARDGRMIVYLPPGRYLVSETIILNQKQRRLKEDQKFGRRDEYPCVIWGGTKDGRASIHLANNTSGFNDPEKPKPVLYSLSYRSPTRADNPNISFNQMIISLDVELGKGNAGAIGVDHQGAQGTVTEDVHVNAEGAFAGFRGTSGSGGSVFHISAKGGRYGLYLDSTDPFSQFGGSQPCPVISAVKLTGQTEKSIYCATRGPLTLVGAEIEGPGIHLAGRRNAWDGALNVIDSVIRNRGEGPVITGVRPVYLRNVYLKNSMIVASLDGTSPLRGAAQDWIRVTEYAATPSEEYPLWINGERSLEPVAAVQSGESPPPGLLDPHWWKKALPDWNEEAVVNVREAPYSAKGDGETDDWEVIQRALNEHQDVFLPKGIYRISEPLRMHSQNRFFGIGVHSKIEPLPEAAAFSDPANANPILISPDDPDASCVAAFFQLWCRYPGSYAIHWQAGRNSMVRNVRTLARPWPEGAPPVDHPLILIDGNGGGRWYNALMHAKFPQTLQHRHVLARGTRQPLRFYMINPEHSNADYMVEFDDVENVRIYSVKSETLGANGPRDLTPFLIHDSQDFRIYGHGGNAVPAEGEPMYRVSDCSDFTLTNFGYQLLNATTRSPVAPVSTWYMLEERSSDGKVLRVPGTDFFTVFRRN